MLCYSREQIQMVSWKEVVPNSHYKSFALGTRLEDSGWVFVDTLWDCLDSDGDASAIRGVSGIKTS